MEDRRMLAAGSLDGSFGNGGVLISQLGFNEDGYSVAVQADGKILIAGTVGDSAGTGNSRNFGVARFNSDGTLDTTFSVGGVDGVNGLAVVDFHAREDLARDLVVDASGRIVVAGAVRTATGQQVAGVARLDSTGQLDPTFGSGGKTTTAVPFADVELRGVALDSSGNIVAAGRVQLDPFDSSTTQFVVMRYDSQGIADSTFDGDGVVVTDFGWRDEAYDVAVQSDDKIVVVGSGSTALATPIKFVVQDLSLPVALQVGQATFAAFARIEWLLASALVVAAALNWRSRRFALTLSLLVALAVIAQAVWLLPILDARVAAIVAGETPPASSHHGYYATLEALKALLLGLIALLGLRTRR
ncbi:MAG: hypothetical protein DCC67_15840, partial [Planctomycetota bacterium]